MAIAELKKGDVKDVGLADAGKRKIERAPGQSPKIGVTAGERQRPAIFKLLGSPDLRHAVGVGTGAESPDRSVDVEKRSIGVKHK